MNLFDKKSLIIIISFGIVLCVFIYFFTNEQNNNTILPSELYVSQNTIQEGVENNTIIIHIDGEVMNPGIISLPTEARISDAIDAAGGTTELADISKINLAYKLSDGQKLKIPSIYDVEEVIYIQNNAGNEVVLSENTKNAIININSASQSELENLPGIGPSTASKIIDYRSKNGNFKKIEDIMNVSGIGESKFNSIKDYICIWFSVSIFLPL